MKTAAFPGWNRRSRRVAMVVAGMVAAGGLHAADAAPRNHALFMGADVEVKVGAKVYAVRDVAGKSFVVMVGGKEQRVTSQQSALELMVKPELKLASGTALITDFQHGQGYTAANDPAAALSRSLNQAAQLNASNAAAVNDAQGAQEAATLRAVQTGGASAASARSVLAQGGGVGALSPNVFAYSADKMVQGTEANLEPTATSAGADNETAGDKGFSHGFDAIDVSFGLSSPRPLTHPFLITIAEFHTKGEKAGLVRRQIHARELGPIDQHPTQIRFQQAGFPPGFELRSFELHLYDHGQEVATNVAPNYVALTQDEAFEYIKLEYLAAHPRDTLKAVAVLGDLPPDFALRMAQGKYPSVYYVRVSKDGLPLAVYGDEAGRERVSDPFIGSVIQRVRFKPALQGGKPIESIAFLNLAQVQS